jgi:hypothetical protein
VRDIADIFVRQHSARAAQKGAPRPDVSYAHQRQELFWLDGKAAGTSHAAAPA